MAARPFQKTVVRPRQLAPYTCPATVGVIIVPSGSTTTKNGFTGLVIRDCSERSLAMEKSPLMIPERVHAPDTMQFLMLGIATTIAATTRDIRKKVILSQVCTAYRADWMHDGLSSDTLADTHLSENATNEITRKGQFM